MIVVVPAAAAKFPAGRPAGQNLAAAARCAAARCTATGRGPARTRARAGQAATARAAGRAVGHFPPEPPVKKTPRKDTCLIVID